ncbi:hypothetical protein E2320_012900, partial [Naja naja]
MATYTPPEPFNPNQHDWVAYMGQFRMFLQANALQEADDERKRPLFLGYCGHCLYKMAQTLAAYQNHGMEGPTRNATGTLSLCSITLCSLDQQPGETINEYVTKLRDIAAGCKFEKVDQMLIMRDLRLQRKLVTKKALTLKEVLEEARAAELSDKPTATNIKSGSIHSPRGADSRYPEEEGEEKTTIGHSDAYKFKKRHITVQIGEELCNMEIDSGSYISM